MLDVRDVSVSVSDKQVLKNVSVNFRKGSISAIIGPNASGKSSLLKAISGYPDYSIASGSIRYDQLDLLSKNIEERASLGLFLAHQNPVEIPGIQNFEFLRMIYNNKMKLQGKEELDAMDFDSFLDSKFKLLSLPSLCKSRGVNESFSGGEKKKNEILQMLLLEPNICLLDEIDSGLDVDSLKTIVSCIKDFHRNSNSTLILVTHYFKVLETIVPDIVYLFKSGECVMTGDASLIKEVDKYGYTAIQ